MLLKTQTFKHFSWAFLALLILSSPLLFTEKEFLNLWLNQHHSPFLDVFFKYTTHLGNAWLLLPLLIFALSRNYFLSLVLFVTTIFESVLVQVVLKNGFFSDIVRPIKYISQSDILHRVEGISVHSLHSFPSGHAQTAFLIFTFLALFCKRSSSAYILLFLAALVALSRVYLLQHFFIDVWFGAIIGYIFPVGIAFVFYKYTNLSTNPKWEKGFSRFNKK
ncbi:MAG: phosphatase PAP2 family protein [Bacteroidales bacterium]|nr:phosphatase PAP2 family protein [Bacteroidales bacterium]